MTGTKAPVEKGSTRGKSIDWESVEQLYRAGAASLRDIGAQYGCSEGAIRKKAKAEKWQRDLTEKVRQRVRTELVRSQVEEVRTTRPVRTEHEVVEAVADFQLDKLRSHQNLSTRGRRVSESMLTEMEMHAEARQKVVEKINASNDADERHKLQTQLATTFAGFITQVAAGGNAARSWITMEREAYNINGDGLPPAAPPTPLEDLSDDELDKRIANSAKEGGISLAAVREGAQDT